ncbi:MAG: hypothetical protein JXR19_04565 [Bacteroidia bacterium]
MKKAERYISIAFLAYFVVFVILHIINLDRIPLVWFDEVMGLDPAVNAIFKEGYQSRIWPQTGTENGFMAYLPVRFLFHMLHLLLLPFEVFWMRIPWAIYFFTSAYILYLTSKAQNKTKWLVLLVVFLFINDRTVFEVARSMRVDALSLMFSVLLYYCFYKRLFHWQMLLSSLLVFIHPNLWMIALVLFLDASFKWNRTKDAPIAKPNAWWLIPIGLLVLYGWSINFNINGLYTQLFEHGSDHSASGGLITRIGDHFYTRFWPYYLTQPWMPFIIYGALIMSVFKIWNRKYNALHIAVLATHLYWLLALAPFYRYNAVLLLLSMICLLPELQKMKWNKRSQAFSLLLLILMPINTLAIHSLALSERSNRDPKQVVNWLKNELGEENCLVFGHDVTYYAVATDMNKDYMMFNLQPTKFSFEDYDAVYAFLGDYPDSFAHVFNDLPRLYFPEGKARSNLAHIISQIFNKPSYAGLMLYRVESKEDFELILEKMDKDNRSRKAKKSSH